MRIVVLGGYGLIGAACLRALRAAGHHVVGVGRDRHAPRPTGPGIDWAFADLARIPTSRMRDLLAGADVVVNAAGALQDGPGDDLQAIHARLPATLADALTGTGTRVVQISAVGATLDASTAFLRSKAQGDRALLAADVDAAILRPGLVLASQAWGGTALLRAAAALPVGLRLPWDAPLHTVWIEDVTRWVVDAAAGRVAPGTVVDLAEPEGRDLTRTIAAMRDWLGLPPPKVTVPVPAWTLAAVGRAADAMSWLGWRPPLRRTALRVLADGVRADPARHHRTRILAETLAAMPATAQDRVFARGWPLVPVCVATLSAFWLLSGLIGAWRHDAATAVLTARGVGSGAAEAAVWAGVAIDLVLGAAVTVRRWCRPACLGMVAVGLGYLAAATGLAPDLWADPLGPLVKVLPATVLALVTAALVGGR